jgi:hypothetical protein
MAQELRPEPWRYAKYHGPQMGLIHHEFQRGTGTGIARVTTCPAAGGSTRCAAAPTRVARLTPSVITV